MEVRCLLLVVVLTVNDGQYRLNNNVNNQNKKLK